MVGRLVVTYGLAAGLVLSVTVGEPAPGKESNYGSKLGKFEYLFSYVHSTDRYITSFLCSALSVDTYSVMRNWN